MGETKANDPFYSSCASGKTISPYDVNNLKISVLVVNKILPNSRRKLKAALIDNTREIAESLLVIKTTKCEVYPYLLLMLNSKPIELSLRSLVSNINLNIFRFYSLPIPEPTANIIHLAQSLFLKCRSGHINFDEASAILAKHVFNLTKAQTNFVNNTIPGHLQSEAA